MLFPTYELSQTLTLHHLAFACAVFSDSNHKAEWVVGRGLPAVFSQEVDHIHRGQTSIQMLHVHQDSKGKAACNMLALLYQQDRPQQDACIAGFHSRDIVKKLILSIVKPSLSSR